MGGGAFCYLWLFEEVNSSSDGEKVQGEVDSTPSPLSPFMGAPLRPTFSLCLFCDKHFHLHTDTQSLRHGILWVEVGI